MSAPTNIAFCAESVGKCTSKIGWIIDVANTARLLLYVNTIAFSNDTPMTKEEKSNFSKKLKQTNLVKLTQSLPS